MAKRWTPEEDEQLLRYRAEGLTAREIAARMKDRSHSAVRTRTVLIASDNRNRTWTDEEKELVFSMKADGKSNKEIARRIDRTLSAVSSFVFRYWTNASKPDLDS